MKTLSVCSFKGGTGKTSIALNVGALFAHNYKKRVLLIDFDAQANLTAGLGLDPDSHDSLAPVLQGNKQLDEVVVKTTHPLIDLIPADTWLERIEVTGELSTDRYSHEKLKKTLAPLDYDFCIIDTPPSLCWLTESALIACSHALVCATPEFYSIKGLQRLSYFMHYIDERHPFALLGVALSLWNPRGKNNDAFLKVIEETFPGKVCGAKVRRDIAISEASIHGKPVCITRPKSRGASDYLALAEELFARLTEKDPEVACLR